MKIKFNKLKIKEKNKNKKTSQVGMSWRSIFSLLMLSFLIAAPIYTGLNLSADYVSTVEMGASFQQSVDTELIQDKIRAVKEFEKLEWQGDQNFSVHFLDLSQKERENVENKMKEIEGFDSISFEETKRLETDFRILYFFAIFFVLIMTAGYYLIFSGIPKGVGKSMLVSAFVLSNALSVIAAVSILAVFSYFIPLEKVVIEFGSYAEMLGIGVSGFIAMKLSAYLKNSMIEVKEFDQAVRIFFEKNYLSKKGIEFWLLSGLIIIIFSIPFIAISSNPANLVIVGTSILLTSFYISQIVIFQIYSIGMRLLRIIKK